MKLTKKRAILSACGALLAVYAVGAAQVALNSRQTAASTPAQPLQAPALVADAKQLGINYAGIILIYSSRPTAVDVADGLAISAYDAPTTIIIKSGLPKKVEINALAYEYMHYVWHNETADWRKTQGQIYENYYQNNANLQRQMVGFTGGKDLREDEMNSILCTRIDPQQLSTDFNAYCNQNIPNRSLLFAY